MSSFGIKEILKESSSITTCKQIGNFSYSSIVLTTISFLDDSDAFFRASFSYFLIDLDLGARPGISISPSDF